MRGCWRSRGDSRVDIAGLGRRAAQAPVGVENRGAYGVVGRGIAGCLVELGDLSREFLVGRIEAADQFQVFAGGLVLEERAFDACEVEQRINIVRLELDDTRQHRLGPAHRSLGHRDAGGEEERGWVVIAGERIVLDKNPLSLLQLTLGERDARVGQKQERGGFWNLLG